MAAPDFIAPSFCAETIAPPGREREEASRVFAANAVFLVEILADFLICSAGILVTFFCCSVLGFSAATQHSIRQIAGLSSAFGFTSVFLLYRDGSYRGSSGLLQIRETERVLRIAAQALFLMFAISSLLGMAFYWATFLVGLVLIPASLITEKQILLTMMKRLHPGERRAERAVIYGASDVARIVASTLLQSPRLGLEPVAIVADASEPHDGEMLEMGYRGRRAIPVCPEPLTPALLKSLRCDLLLLAVPHLSREQVEAACGSARQIGLDVALYQGPGIKESLFTESIDVDGAWLTTLQTRGTPRLYLWAKRIADVMISAVLLILLAPLFLLIAIFIRIDSPGPAFFVQKRVGCYGQLFDIYKFRSMLTDAPQYAISPQSANDPRLTRVGRLIRRMSLDELPQLINVLFGTMSLVGPRPEMPFIVERYDEQQRQRLQVRPGITGLWQLSADRAYPIHQNIEYDIYYIRNRSLSMDVAILLHTLVFAFCRGI